MYDTGNEFRQFSYDPATLSYDTYNNEAPLMQAFDQSAVLVQPEQHSTQELCVESQTVLKIGENLDFYRQQMLEMQEAL